MERNERLQILRILNGFTHEKLADIAGISRASISAWERGDYNPSARAAKLLSPFLSCLPGYLVFGTPPVSGAVWIPSPSEISIHLSKMKTDLLNMMPIFMLENSFSQTATGLFADSGRYFVFGRINHFDNILLADPHLADTFYKAVGHFDMHDFGSVNETMKSFNKTTLSTIASTISKSSKYTIDTEQLYLSFVKAAHIRSNAQVAIEIELIKEGGQYTAYNNEGGSSSGANQEEAVGRLLLSSGIVKIIERA